MKIFEKRPLSLILCIMLGGFSFFIGADIATVLSVIGIILALILSLLLFVKTARKTKLFAALCLVLLALSVLLAFLWKQSFFPSRFYDSTIELRGQVTYSEHLDASPVLKLTTEKINGEDATYKIIAYGTREQFSGVNKGDTVVFTARVSALEENSYGDFDSRTYLISQGISATATLTPDSSVKILSHSGFDPFSFFEDARIFISGRLKLLTNEQTGAFLSALITGDRSTLDSNTELNFKRIGISHILALSGTHLAMLSALLLKLFRLLRLNKKVSVTLSAIFSFLYMALTGMSPSITRAGLMVIIGSALFLVSGCRDGITALFLSVSLIVLFNPYSVFDLSLWLSAFATLGVLFYVETKNLREKNKPLYIRALLYLRDGILISVFAIIATFAVTLFSFGEFSVVSVISTLLFSFLVEILIYLGLLTLIFGNLIPIGELTILVSDLIKSIAEWFSSADWVYVAQNDPALKALMLTLLVFFFAYMLLGQRYRRCVASVILSLMFLAVCVAGIASSVHGNLKDAVIYSPSDSSDMIIVKSEGNAALVCSGISAESSYFATNLLDSQDILYLDSLILPSYSYNDRGFVEYIISKVKTDVLYLPMPRSSADMEMAESLAMLISAFSTELSFYSFAEQIRIGQAEYTLHANEILSEQAYPQNLFTIRYNHKTITYVSAGLCDSERIDVIKILSSTDALILGANGNYYPERFYLCLSDLELIVFGEELELTRSCKEFYEKTGASRIYAESSVSIYEN